MAYTTDPLVTLAQCRYKLETSANAQKEARERLAQAKALVESLDTALEEVEDGLVQDVFLARDAFNKPKFTNKEDREREVRTRMRTNVDSAGLKKDRDGAQSAVVRAQLDLQAAELDYRRTVDTITALTAEVQYLAVLKPLTVNQ